MSGLIGSMLAGGVKGYADGKVKDIEQKEQFDLKMALMDAQHEKNLLEKKMGFEMEDARIAKQEQERAKLFEPVEESTTTPESIMQKYTDENGVEQVVKSGGETVTKSRPATANDAAERAFKVGKFAEGEGLLKLSQKENKGFESIKLDDGSIVKFDKNTGTASIAFEGSGDVALPKNESEILWRAAQGDETAIKAAQMIVEQKKAGRAPTKASDEDLTYADWKKKPENKGKGRDDFYKWKKQEDGANMQSVTEEPLYDIDGQPVLNADGTQKMKSRVTRKEPIPDKPVAKEPLLGDDPLGLRIR